MRIHFLGAAQTVTGSMHLLETAAGRVLIDCGMFQGRREESRQKNRNLPALAKKADAVILSHAHIDHSGNLPTLVKGGFQGTIFSTPATRDLCSYLLRDSARIQEGDAKWLNEKNQDDPEWIPIEPLYVEEDAVAALGHFVSVPYGKAFDVLPGVKARFLDAGHILGSAQVLVDVTEGARTRRILFSGDLGRKGVPLLRDPEVPPATPPIDYMLLESTYGNRLHSDAAMMEADLEKVIRDTVTRKGKVIVPAFAVGRTQELLYCLDRLYETGRLPRIPVYVDSPLAVSVTGVFKLHPECFDAETRRLIAEEEDGDVLGFPGCKMISTREDSMKLNTLKEPAIIISASGMAEAGRILHHLRNNIEDPRNTVLVVGFMAQHTLGRRIVERRPRVKILGVERDLRAEVRVLNAFSAHADQGELVAHAVACGKDVRHVFLVHGEPEAQAGLAALLAEKKIHAHAPAPGESAELE